MENQLVIRDQNTDTEIHIPQTDRQQLDIFTRMVKALYAAHNTGDGNVLSNITTQLASQKGGVIESEWYLVSLDIVKSIRANTGRQFNLNDYDSTLRETQPLTGSRTTTRRVGGAG